VCKICSKDFFTEIGFQTNRSKEHQHEESIFEAKPEIEWKCKVEIGTRKNQPFQCQECCKQFVRKCNLKIFTKAVHNNIKLCKCQKCETSFTAKRSLKNHTEAVRRKNNPFKCQECDKNVARKDHLKGHINSVHGKATSTKCQIYDQGFTLKSDLQFHIKSINEKKLDPISAKYAK